MDSMNNAKNKHSNSKFIVCIILLCIVIVIAGVIIWHLAGKSQMPGNEGNTTSQDAGTRNKDFLVTEENVDRVMEELNKSDSKAPSTFDVMMNSNWNFETGASESSNAHVTNSTANKNTVYFDVYLAQTKEVVYSSPYLKVGDDLKGFKLDKELEPGKYDAICKYYILDEDLNSLCNVSVNVTLNIGAHE